MLNTLTLYIAAWSYVLLHGVRIYSHILMTVMQLYLLRMYLRLCVIWLATQVKASLDPFHLVAHSPCKHFCVGGLSGHECRLSATISPQINALTLQWTHKLNHDLQLWSQQSQSGIHNRITYNYCVLLYDQLRSYFILSCSWWWRGLPNAPHPPWQ